MISIVQFSPLQRSEQQSMYHVSEEIGLFRVLSLGHRDVRQHLLLQYFLSVVDSLFSREGSDRSTTSDKVQRDLIATHPSVWLDTKGGSTNISRLNRESILQTRLEHFEELDVVSVVADVIENVLVGNDVERSENYDDRNVVSNVRQRSLNL